MNRKLDWHYPLILGVLGAIFFIPLLGGVHLFDWDEINFAEISREMLITGEYFRIKLNFLPFWEKPPLFFWLQAVSMSVFGVNEFAARLPNAIIGIFTLILLFKTGKQIRSTRFGLLWAGAYFGSVLPFLYFKSGIIDPLFNLMIFLGLHFFIKGVWRKKREELIWLQHSEWRYFILAGLFIGLAMLTKGPAAFIIISLCLGVYWLFARFRFFVSPVQFIVFCIVSVLTLGLWFGPETIKNGPWFVESFIKYQYRLFSTEDAGHGGFPGYHFLVLLVGCFPASVFAIRAFFKMPVVEETSIQKDYLLWMKILFWVVLILFSIVQSKIVHYSSLAYFPLTFLAALVLDKILKKEIRFATWMKAVLVVIGALFIAATFVFTYFGRNMDVLRSMITDPFALGNLEASVNWTGFEIVPGIILLTVLGLFFWFWKKEKQTTALKTLFGGTAVFVFTMLIFFVGRIEGYSQRAAISFFESKAGEDCYVHNFAYKSYAQLFYTQKQIPENPNSHDQQWLLEGDIDKDVYFITKVHKAKYMPERDDIIEIGRKNGFVFYHRPAASE
jgi:4-amino-4-deoxy-L-arabinose transferase-like glycosyltransferase